MFKIIKWNGVFYIHAHLISELLSEFIVKESV